MRYAALTLALGIAAGLAPLAGPAQAAKPRPLPAVLLTAGDAHGCGRVARMGNQGLVLLRGAAPGLCVRAAFAARLEPGARPDAVNVVLLVAAPHRFDPDVRTRLFVYRLRGRRLVPRFLGSGFRARALLGAERLPAADAPSGHRLDSLRVTTVTPAGQHESLRCAFVRFPLSCQAELPSAEALISAATSDRTQEALP